MVSRWAGEFWPILDSNLVVDTEYTLSAWLHQAVRSDLNNPGGYEIYLSVTPGSQTELLGFLGSTTAVADGWVEFSVSFAVTASIGILGARA